MGKMGFREDLHSKREAAREHAELASEDARGAGQSLFERLKPKARTTEKPAKKQRAKKTSIAAHKAFIPLLAGWGAALAGLMVAVLPASSITGIMQTAQLTVLGGAGRIVLALLAALFGGLIAFAIARVWSNSASSNRFDSAAALDSDYDRVRPIDPSAELGSESLDAPIDPELAAEFAAEAEEFETEPFVAEFEASTEEFATEEFAEEAPLEEPQDEPLDLGMIAEVLPEDELVLDTEVFELAEETEAPEPVAETAPPLPADAPDFLRGAALESLRQIPKDELSLMQMVERFAAALHAHQAIHGEGAQPRRDAALAEALRALSLFTEGEAKMAQIPAAAAVADGSSLEGTAALSANGFSERAQQTERELRDALAKLQKLSGAA